MTLADYIEANLEDILSEWDRFAGTLGPAARGLDQEALRNFGERVLRTIAEDMRSTQSPLEKHDKSRGERGGTHSRLAAGGREHAVHRLMEGFTLDQMVAEYRALRASVIRRWTDQLDGTGRPELDELTRFNEAVDESMAEAIRWYSERLEQARDLYSGALAHDLRNPLGAILNSAELLSATEPPGSTGARVAHQVLDSGHRMQKMIEDLLDFTRTRLGGGLPLELEAQDMTVLARNVASELEGPRQHCPVRLELPEALPGVWDGARIQQMLSNLLGNALRHCRPGTAVMLRAQRQGDRLLVEVHNQGPPIPASLQGKLFDPLIRGVVPEKERTGATGLGLGLYIARQVAEAHGGTIEVTSSEDHGTTFAVTLPRESRAGRETAGVV